MDIDKVMKLVDEYAWDFYDYGGSGSVEARNLITDSRCRVEKAIKKKIGGGMSAELQRLQALERKL
jgi:hypothetical protein